MSLDDKMTELADAIRKKTNATGKLGIEDMIKALTSAKTAPKLWKVRDAFYALGDAVRKYTGVGDRMTIEQMAASILEKDTSKVLDRSGLTSFGSSTYDVFVPEGTTKLEITVTVTNGSSGQAVTVSVPGTSITTTISSGGYGFQTVTGTLTIPEGKASSIHQLTIDAGRRNALRAVSVKAVAGQQQPDKPDQPDQPDQPDKPTAKEIVVFSKSGMSLKPSRYLDDDNNPVIQLSSPIPANKNVKLTISGTYDGRFPDAIGFLPNASHIGSATGFSLNDNSGSFSATFDTKFYVDMNGVDFQSFSTCFIKSLTISYEVID